ncbi:uncharacterized protein STEHIDRAFT_158918 [Stereum hirsutum FP-91666 SS1]|uniref:uncharacterized protein n=1 Tax=Stereum hirsutum (strain FP-91666) TaxID=721885 RepID=UPI000444A5F8|nr:uncharacterized protein STEHIDRAFT_158918 [Stereum hirsutum FP-91666 SS1]EIM84227.1 hypothetical protein STEHIDRAFT_158918 [Stereum hirsutum FP-91666 SS1]
MLMEHDWVSVGSEPEKVSAAIDILGKAFSDADPIRKALTGNDPELIRMMNTGLIGAALEEGQLFVAEDANKKVVGTISWFPPGTERLGSDAQRSRGSNAFATKAIEQRPEAYKWYFSSMVPAFKEMTKQAFGRPEDPDGSKFLLQNWCLNSFAVSPEYQGKGIGRLLLKYGEAAAASNGLCVVLDTYDTTVPTYEAFGYRAVTKVHVDGMDGDSGFNQCQVVKEFA